MRLLFILWLLSFSLITTHAQHKQIKIVGQNQLTSPQGKSITLNVADIYVIESGSQDEDGDDDGSHENGGDDENDSDDGGSDNDGDDDNNGDEDDNNGDEDDNNGDEDDNNDDDNNVDSDGP